MAETKSVGSREATRRSERVHLQIPIEVQGELANGVRFRESSHTLIIHREGARISLEHPVEAGAVLHLTNLRTGVACPFRVVGKVDRAIGRVPEWGVECLKPEIDFWGIHFPADDGAHPETEHVDVLVECSGCYSRELARLGLRDYRDLSSRGVLGRNCPICGRESEWTFGYAEALAQTDPWQGDAAPAETPSSGGGEEKRIAKRLAVKLPISIRLPNGQEEVARTENLSRMGVCFISDLKLEEGDFIRLTVGYVLGENADEVMARVVWRRSREEANGFIYGVHLEHKE
ncbi:MAG TPA: PilZ domain-containing protein [Terriglobia bacterium]|nr:PilZ domain-containing protein [Terriglobia bacterium]